MKYGKKIIKIKDQNFYSRLSFIRRLFQRSFYCSYNMSYFCCETSMMKRNIHRNENKLEEFFRCLILALFISSLWHELFGIFLFG